MILTADHVIDIGPRAGIHGGYIVAEGKPSELLKFKTLTTDYITGIKQIQIPSTRRNGNGKYLIPTSGIGYLISPAMTRGSTLHIVYSSTSGSWHEIGLSSVGDLPTLRIGKVAGLINQSIDITHADGSLVVGSSFLVCRNKVGTEIGGITQSGENNVLHPTSSDYRLKHDVTPLTGALGALRPCTYLWPDETHGEGFLAHELGEHVPAAVVGEKDALTADGAPKYQQVDMSRVVPHLVGAIQELTQRLAALENNV